ncbi:MAG: hypothetical protein M3O01_13445 [Pseudomonadota bacterium]|nr:hypothetical protein [Pseudomonadota bacterium]
MSNLSDLSHLLAKVGQLLHGHVLAITAEGRIEVRLAPLGDVVACRVLHGGGPAPALEPGDEVLVWLFEASGEGGVVMGRIGLQGDAGVPVASAAEFAARPLSMVIETQGDLVLRNGHARIKLGSQGDIEIVCTSFVTRSQRLLRLLAPFIKLN